MRPLEVLLSAVNLLTIAVLSLPPLFAIHWMAYLALAAAAMVGIQVSAEGLRWQMVPAYALAGILALVWLQHAFAPAGRLPDLLGIGSSLGLGAVWLFSIALPAILPVFRFPRPQGPYQIGCVTYHWVDAGRREAFSADPGARRELMAQVWYPAEERPASARAHYVQGADTLSVALAQLTRLPSFTLNHFRYVTTNAIPSAPPATDSASRPVLIFLAGLDGFRQMNTFQVEHLVSHGYIVAAIDQPYAAGSITFPGGHRVAGWTKSQMEPFIQQSLDPDADAPLLHGEVLAGGVIPYLAQDVSFALDQLTALNADDPSGMLTGRLDLRRVGTLGVSLGAMVASEAAYREARIKAVLMMDAAMPAHVVQAGLVQPSMWLTRDADTMRLERQRAGGWSEADIHQTITTMRSVFSKKDSSAGYYVQIPGMFHLNFTDSPYYSPLLRVLGLVGPSQARRGHQIINACSRAFFDQHLGCRQTVLENPATQFPDIVFETR